MTQKKLLLKLLAYAKKETRQWAEKNERIYSDAANHISQNCQDQADAIEEVKTEAMRESRLALDQFVLLMDGLIEDLQSREVVIYGQGDSHIVVIDDGKQQSFTFNKGHCIFIVSQGEAKKLIIQPVNAKNTYTWGFAVMTPIFEEIAALPHWPVTRTLGDIVDYSETIKVKVPVDATIHYQTAS